MSAPASRHDLNQRGKSDLGSVLVQSKSWDGRKWSEFATKHAARAGTAAAADLSNHASVLAPALSNLAPRSRLRLFTGSHW